MSGRLLAVARRAGQRAGAPLLAAWARTMPLEVRGFAPVSAARATGPLIITFFHARFLLLTFVYPRDRPLGVLISPSADGDLISDVIAALGRTPIRGSSRRGGSAAYREMLGRLAQDWDLGIAVDGPRGPAWTAKEGAVRLVRQSGRPIVPVVYATRRGHALGSWDRFWIPAPFSPALVLWGEPMEVRRSDDTAATTATLTARMQALLAEAEAWAGRQPPWLS